MERQTKMKNREKESFEKRSPLQRLNGLQIRKPNCKNMSSTSVSVSFEVPNDCPRLLLSSTSSSSSSSSKINFHRKPYNLPTTTNNPSKSSAVTLKPRSKENEVPKKPFSQKPMKYQPSRLDKKQFGKPNTKLTLKNAQRPNLCSAQKNRVKIYKEGSEHIVAKLKNSDINVSGEPNFKLFGVSSNINLDCIENRTPDGKIVNIYSVDSVNFDYPQSVKNDSISETANGKNSDNAAKTPPVEASVSPEILCGTHSKIPIAKSAATPVCYGAGHLLSGVTDKRKCRRRGSLKGGCDKINIFDDYKNSSCNSWDSLIPLPGEASVRWISSPYDEGREDKENKLDKCKMVGESCAFVELDLLFSSPSTLCGNMSDFEYDKKMHGRQENNSMHDVMKDNSSGSFSRGNIIQSPSSESSSYDSLKGSKVDDVIQFELDSVTKTLDQVGLSPSGGTSEDMDMSSSISEVQENVNSVCSWGSDSAFQTRISWKDGLISRIEENDEFDCCRCLSDEEIDKVLCRRMSQYFGGENKENEACFFSTGGYGINASAESISTNGGELVASGDSDWVYFREK